MRVAPHAKVRADRIDEYECEDYARLLAEQEELPVVVAWQAGMAELPDVAHDYSGEGAGLPVVRELW